MRILIVSHEYPPVGGGGANACQELSAQFADKGHEVHVVTVWYQDEHGYDRDIAYGGASEIQDGNLNIHRVKSPRQYKDHSTFYEMLLFMFEAYRYCIGLAENIRFETCLCFFAIPSGPIAYIIKKRLNIPYVIRFGGGDIPGAQKRYTIVYKIIAPFERLIWHNADALIANSVGLRQRALLFDDKKTISVIPNGVNMPGQVAISDGVMKNSSRDKEIRLLFVSRLIEGKGLQDIFPQLRSLSDRCDKLGKKLRYVIVGDGIYRDTLEKLCDDLRIRDIIEFVGYKNKSELVEYYGTADIFVFPSRSEGMPNVVLEAMSYGLPIVMTPCEGSTELIHDNGFISVAEDFSDRIWDIISDEGLKKHFSDTSRDLAQMRFNWGNTADMYLQIMNGLGI